MNGCGGQGTALVIDGYVADREPLGFSLPFACPGLPGLVEMALDQAYQYWMGADRELIVRTREGTTLLVFERR